MVNNFGERVDFIWSVADLLRGDYKQSEYQKVILPLTVLRRLDCVTEPTKDAVRQEKEKLRERGIENVGQILESVSGSPVYNTSKFTFDTLTNDPENLAENLQHYVRQFDPETEEIIEKFEFDHQIERLNEADLLYKVVTSFAEIDLHPIRWRTRRWATSTKNSSASSRNSRTRPLASTSPHERSSN